MRVAVGKTVYSNELVNKEISVEELWEKVQNPVQEFATMVQYQQATDAQRSKIKDGEYFIFGTFEPAIRKEVNLQSLSAVMLDLDDAVVGLDKRLPELMPYQGVYYSTLSSTATAPRLRVIIFLTREVTKDEYRILARAMATKIGLEYVDPASFKPVQPMYVPHCLADAPYLYGKLGTKLLNPDEVLVEIVNYQELQTFVDSKTPEDPLQKQGAIGAFCKTYTMTQALAKFLSAVYRPSAIPGRYDYLQGKGLGGLMLKDDKFAKSFDSTDPVNTGHLENAFDVVRLHLFSEAELGKAESMKRMLKLVQEDNNVPKAQGKSFMDILAKQNPAAYNFFYLFGSIFRRFDKQKWNDFGKKYHYSFDYIAKVYLKKDGSYDERVLTTTPMVVSGYFHEKDDARCLCQVEYFRDGSWHKLDRLIERGMLVNKSKVVVLGEYDLDVSTSNNKELAEYFQDFLNLVRGLLQEHNVVRSLGWCNDSFYFPGLPTQDKLQIDPGILDAIKEPAGDFAKWKACAQKVRLMSWTNRFLLAAAFTAPFVKLLDYRSNPIFLYAGESGKGKTTLFRLAASVWGNDKFLFSADSTRAGAEARAATLNDVLLAMDDLEKALGGKDQYEKREVVKDILYMLYNGKGSNRSNPRLEAERSLEWRCVSLINSERSIMEKFVKMGGYRRLVEIHNDVELSYEEKKEIDRITAHNYGHACRYLLERLPSFDRENLLYDFDIFVKELQQADQGVHNTSHIDAIAMVALVDATIDCLLFGAKDFQASCDTAFEMAQAILAQQEPEAKRKSGDELYEQFKSWMQAHIHSFDIYYNGQTKNVSVVHRTPERFGAIVDDLVYVDPKKFDAFVEKEAGLASDIGRKMLYDIGVLKKNGRNYTISTTMGGFQARYIVVWLDKTVNIDNTEV